MGRKGNLLIRDRASDYGACYQQSGHQQDVHDNDDELGSGGSCQRHHLSAAGSGNVIRGNRAWRNADDGFDMWNSAPALIENNWVSLSGYDQDGVTPRGDGTGL